MVDKFIAEYDAIAPLAQRAGRQARSLLPVSIQEVAISKNAHDEIEGRTVPNAILTDARRAFAKATTAERAFNTIAQIVRQAVPASVVAVYTYLPDSDVLRCTHAAGDPHRVLFGLEIPSSERTTGWVASNATAIMNSSAALDLGHVCTHFSTALQTTMSLPLHRSGELIAVLTVYSSMLKPFS